ncbi:MAG: hypothetical protein IJ272_05285 [Clostridia bacterium]|nr:hypothetical protein [Clostridia bacterium]
MELFERLKKRGIELKKPNDGILLIVNGDFNDGDDIEQTWKFEYDDIGLVMWLLDHYEKDIWHWDEVLEKKERKLFAKYVPRVNDTCVEIYAHTIYEAHAYIFENGVCREIKNVGSYEIPSTDSLYESYCDD